MPEKPESPFRRDEPVSTSGKWVLMSGISVTFILLFFAFYGIMTQKPPSGVVVCVGLLAAAYFTITSAVRAWKAARLCREHRSFDTMAHALRQQQRYWMVLALLTILMAYGVPQMAYLLRHQNTGLRQYMEEYEKQQAAQPQGRPQL